MQSSIVDAQEWIRPTAFGERPRHAGEQTEGGDDQQWVDQQERCADPRQAAAHAGAAAEPGETVSALAKKTLGGVDGLTRPQLRPVLVARGGPAIAPDPQRLREERDQAQCP